MRGSNPDPNPNPSPSPSLALTPTLTRYLRAWFEKEAQQDAATMDLHKLSAWAYLSKSQFSEIVLNASWQMSPPIKRGDPTPTPNHIPNPKPRPIKRGDPTPNPNLTISLTLA